VIDRQRREQWAWLLLAAFLSGPVTVVVIALLGWGRASALAIPVGTIAAGVTLNRMSPWQRLSPDHKALAIAGHMIPILLTVILAVTAPGWALARNAERVPATVVGHTGYSTKIPGGALCMLQRDDGRPIPGWAYCRGLPTGTRVTALVDPRERQAPEIDRREGSITVAAAILTAAAIGAPFVLSSILPVRAGPAPRRFGSARAVNPDTGPTTRRGRLNRRRGGRWRRT
jgi:hypothetical protein